MRHYFVSGGWKIPASSGLESQTGYVEGTIKLATFDLKEIRHKFIEEVRRAVDLKPSQEIVFWLISLTPITEAEFWENEHNKQ